MRPSSTPDASGARRPVRIDVSRPIWTATLAGLNALVFGLMAWATARSGRPFLVGFPGDVALDFGAWYPGLHAAGEPYRLVTAIFLHGSLVHLLFNSVALVQVGSQLEEVLGRRRFLLLYLVAGVAGFALSEAVHGAALSPERRELVRLGLLKPSLIGVGASGAIFGLFGAMFTIALRKLGWKSRPLRQQFFVFGAYAVLIAVAVPQVDNYAHGGGFVAGALLGLVLRDRRHQGGMPNWAWALVEVALVMGVGLAFALLGRARVEL